MIRQALLAAALVTAAAAGFAPAAEAKPGKAKPYLVIADGDSGRIVYDDGYDDAFCITRRRFVGYDWYGRPMFRRVIRCR